MARQRRGGFRPPELRGTLGTLLRTTLAQAGGLRSALERGAREGRARLDDVLAGRRRTDALAELGELVLDLIRRGEIEIEQLPEARELVAHLDELDAEHGEHDEPDVAPAPSRSRFDDRDGTVPSSKWVAPPRKAAAKVWRPPVEDRPADEITARDRPVPKKKGGISFGKPDDDDDLADYMHPDDVPPKDK
ncbi:MAG TPA: hypothetical protein VFQ65_15135 [Kofleriaceae bacterium]|nr:hypothetical protein [Kofleriaceae bacterium]